MSRNHGRALSRRPAVRSKPRGDGFRPVLERLEERRMLDSRVGADRPDIVVGRTLSSWSVGDIHDGRVAITYTVYNEQADAESGVLLTTTLQTGVNYADASQPPDRSGPALAWSLGTIPGFGRASVTLTVSLASPVLTALDGGARAFATLDARAVSGTAPPAALRAGSSDQDDLASTPDASTTDPFIQQKAAELDYDPQEIFAFLRDEIGYESYAGSLRGARGTLWSGAGNSLDEASLGVALLRASGIPTRYAHGTLSDDVAGRLILSMFPPTFQTVGYVPAGTSVADPAHDPKLLAETRDHYWIEYDAGGGFLDADASFADAQLGRSLTPAAGTFAEVPDALRRKATVSLRVETADAASGLLGGLGGPQVTTVLQRTYNDVDLVGRQITVGHFVDSESQGAAFLSARTITYTPYLMMLDDAEPIDLSHVDFDTGRAYQETFSSFPLTSQVVTGLFLRVAVDGPDSSPLVYERTLADRIGPAARASGTIPPDALGGASPIVTPLDLTTLSISPGLNEPTSLVAQAPSFRLLGDDFIDVGTRLAAAADGPSRAALGGRALDALRNLLIALAHSRLSAFESVSDAFTERLAGMLKSRAYFDAPRVILFTSRVAAADDDRPALDFGLDLRRDSVRVVASPGQADDVRPALAMVRGLGESGLETAILQGDGPLPTGFRSTISATSVLEAARAQGIASVVIGPAKHAAIDALPMPADVKARIREAVALGKVVLAPAAPARIDGRDRVGWFEFDPSTGEAVGVTDDGGHGAILEYLDVNIEKLKEQEDPRSQFLYGLVSGLDIESDVGIVKFLLEVAEKALRTANPPKEEVKTLLEVKDAVFLATVWVVENTVATIRDLNVNLFFKLGLITGIAAGTQMGADPPLGDYVSDPSARLTAVDQSTATTDIAGSAEAGPGQVLADLRAASLRVGGRVSASWRAPGVSAFRVRSLLAASATVRDASGRLVGSGRVTLESDAGVPTTVEGDARFDVQGEGSLSFYAPATAGLGVGGQWSSYAATLTGAATLRLAAGGLTVNGAPLAAGLYSIATNGAILSGDGASTSPNFVDSLGVSVARGVVVVGPSSGGASLGNSSLDAAGGFTLSSFDGTAQIGSGAIVDAITLSGTAGGVLQVSSTPPAVTADQSTPASFDIAVRGGEAGGYAVTIAAPEGWTTAIDSAGHARATPKPGLQGGVFSIRLTAVSKTNPDLIAQGEVLVTVTPTRPSVAISLSRDPVFTVPFAGAQLSTVYQISIHNGGPAADTFTIPTPSIPDGFDLISNETTVTIPAGETGVVGLILRPKAAIPPAGTSGTLAVTATSTTDPAISASATAPFVVPEVHGVTIAVAPSSLNTLPGEPVTTSLSIQAVGNVPDAVTLSLVLPNGLAASRLAPLKLEPGQASTVSLTLTPDSSLPFNTTLYATLTASFGPADAPQTQTLRIPVRLVVDGAPALADAAVVAQQAGDADIAGRLDDLSTALTNLVLTPASDVFRGQALASLDSLVGLFGADPFLAAFVADLKAARDAVAGATAGDQVRNAVKTLGDALGTLASTLAGLPEHRFSLVLEPNSQATTPDVPARFVLAIQNTGTEATTYDFAVTGLPPGVTALFSQSSITLAPGVGSLGGPDGVVLTLTETGGERIPASFTVTASAHGAPGVTLSVPGTLTVRDAFVRVAEVAASPPFAEPGGAVHVSARVLNVVNRQQQALSSFTLTAPDGHVVRTSDPVPLTLGVQAALSDVDLGAIDTTGLAPGQYIIDVTIGDASGQPLPGGSGLGQILVGTPLTASLGVTPTELPPGDSVVTSTLTVHSLAASPVPPLNLVGLAATGSPATGVAIRGGLAYVAGTDDISIVDVSDPALPRLVGSFAGDVITHGGYNVGQVVGDRLYVASQDTNNADQFRLLVFALTDPVHPQLVSNTAVGYHFVSDLFVRGDTAFVPTYGVSYFTVGGIITAQFGDFLSLDLGDPDRPQLAGSLSDLYGPPEGGRDNVMGGVAVDDRTALIVGSFFRTGYGNTGDVQVVDTSDPAHLGLVRTLLIPGTAKILDIAVQGDRALVVGSTGDWRNPFGNVADFGLVGNLTLTVLDISDPRDPKILGSTAVTPNEFPTGQEALLGKLDALDLGNGLFAVSDVRRDGKSVILIVNASDPEHLLFDSAEVPSRVNGMAVVGDLLYATSADGLLVFRIGQVLGGDLTVSVRVPRGTGVDVVPGSFNEAPDRIDVGPDFDTLVWTPAAAALSADLTLTWKASVSGLGPNEARAVTGGATIAFTSGGVPGSLELPAPFVTGRPIVGLDAATRSSAPGSPASFGLTLENPTDAPVTYSLSVLGVPAGWGDLTPTVSVDAHGSVVVPLTLTPDRFAASGDYGFAVAVSGPGGLAGSVQGTLGVAGDAPAPPDPEAHGVVAAILPSSGSAGQGTAAEYVVRLTNVGSITESFSLSVADLPPGVATALERTSLSVPPGAANFRDVRVRLTPAPGTAPGSYPFRVFATSESDPGVVGSASATLAVGRLGVQVALDRPSGAPGESFTATVTNTGQVEQTYDLTAGGPAGLAARLDATRVTLAPGASRGVSVLVGPIDFAVPGPLDLVVIATATSDPAVRSAAQASIAIGETAGLDAGFQAPTRSLPAPGPASFLLSVRNLGNTEDAYTATIVGTGGPIAARLVDAQGRATDSIPVFRLPGLATGVVLVQADLADLGSGTVTVRVQSLTDPGRSSTATATLAAVQAVVPTTIRLDASPESAVSGRPITLVAVVSAPSGVPAGTVTFFVDGTPRATAPLRSVGGASRATLTLADLPAGSHKVVASYGGATGFAASTSGPLAVRVVAVPPPARLKTTARLVAAPSTGVLGRPVTFTAFVTAPGGVLPHGPVTFTVDGVARATVPLMTAGGRSRARWTTAGLAVGVHVVRASYAGSAGLLASTSAPASLTVMSPTGPPPGHGPGAGPAVISLLRFGYHAQPTVLVLTFDTPLDPARAEDPANYSIADAAGRPIAVVAATYDPGTRSVALIPARRLDVHRVYRLTVNGHAPSGLASTGGILIDGNGDGRPGGDYVAIVDRSRLVFDPPAGLFEAAVPGARGPHRAPPRVRPLRLAARTGGLVAGLASRTTGLHTSGPGWVAVPGPASSPCQVFLRHGRSVVR